MIGCDKIMFVCLMVVVIVDLFVIVLLGGLMFDGWYEGKWIGFGMVIWYVCNLFVVGEIDYEGFMQLIMVLFLLIGYCNIMGIVLLMNSLVEVLGMLLLGCVSIFVVYCECGQMVYVIGKCVVEFVCEDFCLLVIMMCVVFENVIVVVFVLGVLINCLLYLIVIVCYMGVELSLDDWQCFGEVVLLFVNCMLVGDYFGESFYCVGGVFVVLCQFDVVGLL